MNNPYTNNSLSPNGNNHILANINNIPNPTTRNNLKYHKLNYIPHLTENIQKIFKKYDHHNIAFGLYNNNKLKNKISNTKDKIPLLDKTHVIYKIDCNNCDKYYIGETSQKLEKRIKQHQYDSNRPNNNNKTALAHHTIYQKHKFDFENTKIIDTANRTKTRKNLESLHITKNIDHTVNYKTDIGKMGTHYANIIKTIQI